MSNDTCDVADCGKPLKRAGLCYSHYMKNWRYGTPTPSHGPQWQKLDGERFGTLLVVRRVGAKWLCTCDCGESRLARSGDLNRTGDANTCGIPGRHLDPTPTYEVAHVRVSKSRGPARDHACVDCGRTAAHWSYGRRAGDRELVGCARAGGNLPYSADPMDYDPRCVPCHKRFDLEAIRSADDAR